MKFFQRTILLTLALLVLVSSTGFTMAMHLCAGELRGLSLFGEAAACLMEQEKTESLPACHKPVEKETQKDDCCSDQQFILEGLDVTSDSKLIITSQSPDIKFLAAVNLVLLQLYTSQTELKPTFALYIPPPFVRDIPVLVQSFLI